MPKLSVLERVLKEIDLKRLGKEVNILLISDLHYDLSKDDPSGREILAKVINEKLVSSLKDVVQDGDWKPDIVIIAGDLVNQGKASGYKHFFELLQKLIETFPLLKNAVFTTPGNHDINRENIVSAHQYLYALKSKFPKNNNSFTGNEIVNTIYTVSQYDLNHKEKKELRNYLINFEKEYFKTYLEKEEELVREHITEKIAKSYPFKGLKTVYTKQILGIDLVSVNSSFFCNFSNTQNDRNNLFFIRDFIDKTIKHIDTSRSPVVTFMHHPYYYMHESEYIYPYIQESPASNNFNKLAEKSDLILSGHVHGELHEPSVIHQKVYSVTNGTTFTDDSVKDKCYPYTYALIKINKPLNKFKLRSYKYDSDKKAFCFNNNKDIYYQFLTKGSLSKYSSELEKIKIIKYFSTIYGGKKKIKKDSNAETALILAQLNIYNAPCSQPMSQVKLSSHNKSLNYLFFGTRVDKNVIILKLESKNDVDQIFDFLNSIKYLPQKPKVFFSIKTSNFLSKDEDILELEFDKFHTKLKSSILSSKYDCCQLDFLYY